MRAGRAVGVRQTGIGRTLVTQARFVIENDLHAAAAVKAGATRLPDAYEAARERLSEMGKRRRLNAGGTRRARHETATWDPAKGSHCLIKSLMRLGLKSPCRARA
jgi:hypothetical protein